MEKLHDMKNHLHCKLAGMKSTMQGMKCKAKSKFSGILDKLRNACSAMGSHGCGCASCGCADAPCDCTASAGVYQGEVHAHGAYPAAAPSPYGSSPISTPAPAAAAPATIQHQEYAPAAGNSEYLTPEYDVPSHSSGSPTLAPKGAETDSDGMFRVEGMTDLDAVADPATPPDSIDPMTEEGRRRQREFGNGEGLPKTPAASDKAAPKVNESGSTRFFRWFGMK